MRDRWPHCVPPALRSYPPVHTVADLAVQALSPASVLLVSAPGAPDAGAQAGTPRSPARFLLAAQRNVSQDVFDSPAAFP